MYVCVCRGITDKQIRHAVDGGARNMRELGRELGVSTVCGKCGPCARDILVQRLRERAIDAARRSEPLPVVPALAPSAV